MPEFSGRKWGREHGGGQWHDRHGHQGTFNPNAVPDAELKIVESQFGAWVAKKYGSIEKAMKEWNDLKVARDDPAQGRVGFRPLFNVANDRTLRDRDTARFLLESQRGFYEETAQFLRGLGFKGLITCSNWATASPQYLGPLEKFSYTVGDFIDRHCIPRRAEQRPLFVQRCSPRQSANSGGGHRQPERRHALRRRSSG